MDNRKMVTNWLKECDEQGILPWEYDFKEEVFIQKSWSPSFNKNPVKRILEKDSNFYGNPVCETEDSMLMQAVYHILWGTYSKNVIGEDKGDCDADVMNSFWTIFRNFVFNKCSDFFEYEVNGIKYKILPNSIPFNQKNQENIDLLNYYKKYGAENGISWEQLILKNYETPFFEELRNNDNIHDFAKLTHTIGNFTLTPKGFNCSGTPEKNLKHKNLKHNDGNNTWSEALLNLKELDWAKNKYLGCTSWKEYYKKFYMDVYEKENAYAYATTEDSQDEFLQKINTAIEQRGKLMTKRLCDELGLTDLFFYKETN